MNLQEELKALKERIAELEEQVKEEQEFPQSGERYWCISGSWVNSFFWKSEQLDLDRYRIGNIFKTEDEAKFALEKLKVEAELRKFSRPFKRGSLNFIICFDTEEDKLYTETRRFMNQGSLYFECIGKIELAI